MKKFIVVALLLCILFSSTSFALTKWACIGDSITIGWKLQETDTYCYKLGVLLGSEYETSNFGHSSRTMLRAPVTGEPYWESPMFPASQTYGPDIVTIMLGTNDAHQNNMPELLPEYEQDGIDMVNIYKALPGNPRVIILTAPPLKPQSDRYEGLFLTNAALFDVAAATGVEIIDIWTILMNSGLPDNQMWKDPIHINGPAHTVVADAIYNYITGGGDPVCDDGTCDPGEDKCNCAADCGAPAGSETNCTDGNDEDCDGFTDCDDNECDTDPACVSACNDNGVCEPGEDCNNCSNDCASKVNGNPNGRYCCGDGEQTGPEGDGRCDGNY